MKQTLNAKVKGPFASPRQPTAEEEWAERERVFAALHPRLGPPPKPYIHIPGLPKPEPRRVLTIKEAMGTVPIAETSRA